MPRARAGAREDMPLRLYNTLTRSKEKFAPLDPANVRLYACGPTVYDHLHIGNGRMLIVFDVLYRLLRHLYGEAHVTYVRNITDVDDKISARAAERGLSIRDLTDEMTAVFHEDARALGCLPPSAEPRATEHIGAIIALIEKLIAKGHAYAAEGHVLFDVPSMPNYGKLSRRPLDEMIAGARVEVAPYKRSPMDFVLWKPSSGKEPGWESPWGRGRPGWHIECSAMSWKHLGEMFDIHGGGIDLVFPHHENEIAQSCAAFGHEKMANFWVHNGHLQVEGEKMSKSLGNFVTIHDVLRTKRFGGRKWHPEAVRLAMLKTHYRQPLDFTVKALEEAEETCGEWLISTGGVESEEAIPESVLQPLQDDLNTPAAITAMHKLCEDGKSKQLQAAFDVLGILLEPRHFEDQLLAFFQRGGMTAGQLARFNSQSVPGDHTDGANTPLPLRIEDIRSRYLEERGLNTGDLDGLIARREAARKNRNWKESDRIRDELAAMGIALKDNKDGTTTWEPKP
jgi:cysteinyl-tRNA synthetase